MIIKLSYNKTTARITSIAVVVFFLVVGIVTTMIISKHVDTNMRESLLLRAKNIAVTLEKTDIETLAGDATDLNKKEYQKTKSVLEQIHLINPDTRFVYLMGLRDGHQFFYVDSEDSTSKDYSPPGQTYDDATPVDIANQQNGVAYTSGPYHDQWGNWISAYAPITDAGAVIAMVGVDVNADQFIKNINEVRAIAFALTLLIVLVTLLLYRLVGSSVRYVEQIEGLNTDLQKSHEYLLRAEDMAQVGRCMWFAATNDVELNKPMMTLLNEQRTRIPLSDLLQYLDTSEVERIKKEHLFALPAKDTIKFKYFLNSPTFGKRKIISVCKLKHDAKGVLVHAVCTVLDVTE